MFIIHHFVGIMAVMSVSHIYFSFQIIFTLQSL